MAPKSVTFRRHDHLVSVLFGDLLSHSYTITFSMFLYLVANKLGYIKQDIILWEKNSETSKCDRSVTISSCYIKTSCVYNYYNIILQ